MPLSARRCRATASCYQTDQRRSPAVVGTAIGLYLIRKTDPQPDPHQLPPRITQAKPERTFDNSEVRDYCQFGQATLNVLADGIRTLAAIWTGAWTAADGAAIQATSLTPRAGGPVRTSR